MKRIPFALERRKPLEATLIRIGEGNPLEANPILFGEGDSPEANPIRYGEGKPLEVNLIHLEKGTPWIVGGGTPGSESHSLWRGGAP